VLKKSVASSLERNAKKYEEEEVIEIEEEKGGGLFGDKVNNAGGHFPNSSNMQSHESTRSNAAGEYNRANMNINASVGSEQ